MSYRVLLDEVDKKHEKTFRKYYRLRGITDGVIVGCVTATIILLIQAI